jgi:hypothetical protein
MKKIITIVSLLSIFLTPSVHAASLLIHNMGLTCNNERTDSVCLSTTEVRNPLKQVLKATLVSSIEFTDSLGDPQKILPAIYVMYTGNNTIILTQESAKRLGLSMGELLNELTSKQSKIIIRATDLSGKVGLVLAIEK